MPDSTTPTILQQPPGSGNGRAGLGDLPPGERSRPKVKKLRLALILFGIGTLAIISTIFGMMMAVASDLPALENRAEYRAAQNSVLLADDRGGTEIAKLTGNNNRILIDEGEISPNIKNAIISIEDRRFFTHKGVDYRGIGRALWADIRQGEAAQGASTITQQFVKNALAAQGDRSVFQKLREAALAYHMERKWSKQKILTQYLNTVYFGNGAYGVESAVRTYFGTGSGRYDPKQRAARNVAPHEAALLAGMISSPSAYDPLQNPRAALERRNLVLTRMLEQKMLTQEQYREEVRWSVPSADDVRPPRPDSRQPYFSTWVTQQVVDRYQSGRVFAGGLKITTTLDPEMQQAAEQAIEGRLGAIGPKASLVAIENKTGEVKALVGGDNFGRRPFNLATNGHRQPGSAFKPFILIEALQKGYGPTSTFESRQKVFGPKDDRFVVNNYEKRYSGVASLASATTNSDNSVYAELGIKLGTRKIARLAERMGIRTDVSTNRAMTLGGLEQGLTPLELASAYSTIANDGKRVSGSLASSEYGPVAIEKVRNTKGDVVDENERRSKRVFSAAVAQQAKAMLANVVKGGTGTRARLPEFAAGKTGTTENYGDAWFVGFNEDWTVAVWVGYPDKLRYMKTEYRGQPVAGGTFPAEIWHDFMLSSIDIRNARDPQKKEEREEEVVPGTPAPASPAPPQGEAAPEGGGETPGEPPPNDGGGGGEQPAPEPEQPPTPAPEPPPTPAPPPGGGGGGGTPPSGTPAPSAGTS